MDNDVLAWVELILAAVLERRDAQPLVDLALRAGVDLDVLQAVLNTTLDSVRDHLLNAAGAVGWLAHRETEMTRRLASEADLAKLHDLGINVN